MVQIMAFRYGANLSFEAILAYFLMDFSKQISSDQNRTVVGRPPNVLRTIIWNLFSFQYNKTS